MLKSLATLAKISKSHLDEKRKYLAALLDKKQKHIDEIKRMEDLLKVEASNIENLDQEFHPAFLAFLSGIRLKEELILNEIDKLNPQINKATDEVAEYFSEMKKYEIVKENREEAIALEEERKAQLEIDEIAIMNFVRKSESDYSN